VFEVSKSVLLVSNVIDSFNKLVLLFKLKIELFNKLLFLNLYNIINIYISYFKDIIKFHLFL